MKKIIAFSGSNSSKSINQKLVNICAELVVDAEVEVLSLRDFIAPLFSEDLKESEGVPQSMQDFHAKMLTADGYLVSIPEHNGSMPAVMKNTLDWVSMLGPKIFNEKPTVFLSTSPGPRGAASSLKHMVEIMPYRGAEIIGSYAVGSFNDKVDSGKITNEEDLNSITELLGKLVQAL